MAKDLLHYYRAVVGRSIGLESPVFNEVPEFPSMFSITCSDFLFVASTTTGTELFSIQAYKNGTNTKYVLLFDVPAINKELTPKAIQPNGRIN